MHLLGKALRRFTGPLLTTGEATAQSTLPHRLLLLDRLHQITDALLPLLHLTPKQSGLLLFGQPSSADLSAESTLPQRLRGLHATEQFPNVLLP